MAKTRRNTKSVVKDNVSATEKEENSEKVQSKGAASNGQQKAKGVK